MNQKGYQIGEVSKITGIPRDTLHFYIKSGLLTPDYIDPENHYNYFSRWNMYQLDIIMTCRNLGVPLEKVRQIIGSKDNKKVVELLMEYQQQAIRLAAYYQQVADDIEWYRKENDNISQHSGDAGVNIREYEEGTVLIGFHSPETISYHANMQEVLRNEMQGKHFVRRTYGYFLELEAFRGNSLKKIREYVKLPDHDYSDINPEHLYQLPSGSYAVFTVCVEDEKADFTPILKWLDEHNYKTDFVIAEELGFQLFQYIHQYYCELRVHLIAAEKST